MEKNYINENKLSEQIPNASFNLTRRIILYSILILSLLATIAVLFWQNLELRKDIKTLKAQNESDQYYPGVIVSPTVPTYSSASAENTESKGCEIRNFVCSYNTEKFVLENSTTNNITDNPLGGATEVEVLNFKLKNENRDILQIVDLGGINKVLTSLDQAMSFAGTNETSPLRLVTVNGKQYSFTQQRFGEGFPSDAEGNCFEGGGVINNYFLLDGKYGIIFNKYYSEKGCKDKPTERTETPDAQTTEEILKIVESIKFSGPP